MRNLFVMLQNNKIFGPMSIAPDYQHLANRQVSDFGHLPNFGRASPKMLVLNCCIMGMMSVVASGGGIDCFFLVKGIVVAQFFAVGNGICDGEFDIQATGITHIPCGC